MLVAIHIVLGHSDRSSASRREEIATAMVSGTQHQFANDLTDSGTNLPAIGRSLFDEILVGESARDLHVPFPFPKLLAELNARAGCAADDEPCYRAVLIPLGRSLQRTAAAPEFFRYPRMVIAFNGESKRSHKNVFPLLKDRLYLGYQEKVNIIEVISYNEEAGRFEFQLVKNYRDNAKPQVFYANRSVCASCHQNQAPIFSRFYAYPPEFRAHHRRRSRFRRFE